MYSRGSGPGGPATPSGPPNMSSTANNSKPGSDYSYANYGSYSADTGYGAPPRSYGSDAGSQVGGYTSQPPNAGAKHFNDFKEWPSSWQPFDNNNVCSTNVTTALIPLNGCASHHLPSQKNIRVYYNALKATFYPPQKHQVQCGGGVVVGEEEPGWLADGPAGIMLKHLSNLNNISMCCNSWKRVGLINMKRAAGLVTPAKINYSD